MTTMTSLIGLPLLQAEAFQYWKDNLYSVDACGALGAFAAGKTSPGLLLRRMLQNELQPAPPLVPGTANCVAGPACGNAGAGH